MRLLPLLCLVVLLLPPALPSRPDLSPGLSGECDANFLRCINHDRCLSCFGALHKGGVDWASVPSHLSCEKAVEYLEDQDQCTDLRSSSTDLLVFCDAFRSCIVWDDEGEGGADDDDDGSGGGGGGGGGGNDDGGGGGDDDDGPKFRGCDHLTECEWPDASVNSVRQDVTQKSRLLLNSASAFATSFDACASSSCSRKSSD